MESYKTREGRKEWKTIKRNKEQEQETVKNRVDINPY